MSDIVERLRDQGKDAFARQYSLGMFKLCTEAADEIERLRGLAATPTNDRHYLSAIRKRLEQLYDASADNPRLREQLSDEVDWVDEQLEGRAIAKEPGNRFCKHDDCPYPDCLVEGGICPSQPTLVSRPHRGEG